MMARSDEQRDSETSDDGERWFGGRRWTGYAAIGFVVVIALCAGILVLTHHSNSAAGQPQPAAVPASTSASANVPESSVPASSAATAVSSPPPSASTAPAIPRRTLTAPPAVPTVAPAGTTWQLVAGQAVPAQPGVGPAHVTDYTASGYAHTPVGALYAAVNDTYRVPIAVSAQADWQTPLKAMVAPGPGLNVLKSVREPLQPEPIGPDGMGMSQLAAFKYVSYTGTDAVIQLVVKDANGGLHTGPTHVQWVSGDWRLVISSDGTITGDSVIDSLDGYVVWQGAS